MRVPSLQEKSAVEEPEAYTRLNVESGMLLNLSELGGF
jgi:hypothetical protein